MCSESSEYEWAWRCGMRSALSEGQEKDVVVC